MSNAFRRLYAQRLITASKPFLARGVTVTRCGSCLLAGDYCICAFFRGIPEALTIDIVLLMHRDEILKPTNSGRLIAEAFPANCYAFEWSRLAPSTSLLELLNDPKRQCALIYPARDDRKVTGLVDFNALSYEETETKMLALRPTYILLDGTWRQAARMYNHSDWLSEVPSFPLPFPTEKGEYSVRQANSEDRLSTAEATANLLDYCSNPIAAMHLRHLFRIFNAHCKATRTCTRVVPSSSHNYFFNLITKCETLSQSK